MIATNRKLPLKIFDLESAVETVSAAEDSMFADSEFPSSAYLNLTTGETISPKNEDADEDLMADDHFLRIPEELKSDGCRTMAAFVESLDPGPVKERLAGAIGDRGAFRRFRDLVIGGGDVELRHAWNWFETRALQEAIANWLEANGIEPEWDRDIFEVPELPNKRPELIAAVLEFVRKAKAIDGVRRIALLGSLATDKAQPKDIDALVEIEDDLSLAGMAGGSVCGDGMKIQIGVENSINSGRTLLPLRILAIENT